MFLLLGSSAKVILDVLVCFYILFYILFTRKKINYVVLGAIIFLSIVHALLNQNPAEFIATFLSLPLLLFPLYLIKIERFDNIVWVLLIIFLGVLSFSSLESIAARSAGLTASPTHLGLYAALIASFYIVHGRFSSVVDLSLLCLMLIVAMFCVYASGSRGSALILGAVIIHKVVLYCNKKPVISAFFLAALLVVMLTALPKFGSLTEVRALSYNSHSDERRFEQIVTYGLSNANTIFFGIGRANTGSVGVNLYRMFPSYYNTKPDSPESLLITLCISFGYFVGLTWFIAYLRFSKVKSRLFLCLPSLVFFQGLEGPLFFVLFTALHQFKRV
ncbi:hypothetical protein N9755_01395 [bacterium]|nr:hypothetical protein [bacterium]